MALPTRLAPRDSDLRRTIRSYDAEAEAYAERFRDVHLADDQAEFIGRLPSELPVLDAGCGSGRDCRHLSKAGCLVLGADLSAGLLRQARAMGHPILVQADMRALPLRQDSFGGVWSCASLLHLDDEGVEQAFAEFHRILVSGGVIFVTVREGTDTEWRADSLGGRRWHRFFELEGLAATIKGAGFRVVTASSGSGSSAPGRWISIHAIAEEREA